MRNSIKELKSSSDSEDVVRMNLFMANRSGANLLSVEPAAFLQLTSTNLLMGFGYLDKTTFKYKLC